MPTIVLKPYARSLGYQCGAGASICRTAAARNWRHRLSLRQLRLRNRVGDRTEATRSGGHGDLLSLRRRKRIPTGIAQLIPSARTPAPNLSARTPGFADRLEAWGAASLFGVFGLLPLDRASALGGALARRIGPFLGVSKHARRNISRPFPELSDTDIARVVAGMWDNLGRVAAEYPHFSENPRFRTEWAGRDARLRTCGSCSHGRPANDRLLRPYRQLGDRYACRSPARNLSRPNLPRSQQSAA